MTITFQGSPITLEGNRVKVGDKAPNFKAVGTDLNEFNFNETKGKRIILSVPSVDTPVCDIELNRFNKEASSLKDVNLYAVSLDLPFAQGRWCGATNVDNLKVVSDYKFHDFAKAYGLYIKELGLLSRAVFVIDENDTIIYADYLQEITNEPNYEEILNIVK